MALRTSHGSTDESGPFGRILDLDLICSIRYSVRYYIDRYYIRASSNRTFVFSTADWLNYLTFGWPWFWPRLTIRQNLVEPKGPSLSPEIFWYFRIYQILLHANHPTPKTNMTLVTWGIILPFGSLDLQDQIVCSNWINDWQVHQPYLVIKYFQRLPNEHNRRDDLRCIFLWFYSDIVSW